MKSALYFFSNLGTKIFLFPITFFVSIWIARFLGPEEKGIYAYILTITSFFIPIFSLGIGSGIRYYVSKKSYKLSEVSFTTTILGVVIGLVNAMLLFCFWKLGLLGKTLDILSTTQVIFVSCILIFNAVYNLLSRLAIGDSRFHTVNFIDILKNLMNPVLMILLVYFLAFRINGVLYGLLILNVSMAGFMAIRIFSFSKPELKINPGFIKKSFIYGFKGWLGDMSVRANVRLDQLILGGIISAKSLGVYSVGVSLVEMLWLIPGSLGSVLFNRLAAEKNIAMKVLLTEKIHRILFILSFIISIFWIYFCVFVIIPFGYGEEFKASMIPLLILVPGTLLYIPAKVTTKLLSSSGKILETTKATAFGSFISIILYFILIPRYEIIGAAVASSVGYIFISIFCIYYTKKHFNLKIKNLLIPTKSDYYWIKHQFTALKKFEFKGRNN